MTYRSAGLAPELFTVGLIALVTSCTSIPDQSSIQQWETWSVGEAPMLDVGEIEGNPDYIFSRIAALKLLPGGRVAVADGGTFLIRVYRADGLLEAEFGARGQGPGEFESLRAIEFVPPDTILAYDSRRTRVTKFSTDGTLQSTVQIQAERGIPEIYAGQSPSGDHVIAWIRFGDYDQSALTPDLMDVGRFDPQGRLLGLLTTMPGMRRLGGPIPFSPHFAASMIGDRVAMTDGMSGTIRVVELAQEVESATQVELEPPSLQEAWHELEMALETSEQVEQLQAARASAPDSIPVFSDLLTDDQGNLWLKQYAPTTDSHLIGRPRNGGKWIVARLDGSIMAAVDMPQSFQLMDVSGGRIAGVVRDPLGVESVRVYELVRE